jgi:hypothetical protein
VAGQWEEHHVFGTPQATQGEHAAERLEPVVRITPRSFMRRSGSERVHRTNRAPLRGAMQAAGMGEISIAGGTGSPMQPIMGMRVRRSTQNTTAALEALGKGEEVGKWSCFTNAVPSHSSFPYV